jgi:hypothetical protein
MYELDLLIILGSFLIMALSGTYLGSLVLDVTMVEALSLAIKSLGVKIWVYVIFGIFGFFGEMNSLYFSIKFDEQYKIKNLSYKPALGLGLGIATVFPGYAILNYLLGNYDTTLVGILMVGGVGFSLITLMALAGAIAARIKRYLE